MKNLLTTTFLIFLFGTIIYSNSEAKVLPIIEGSELLDTLASQNNEEVNLTGLNAGIYKHVDFKHMILYLDEYPLKKMNYYGKWVSCYSIKDMPFDSYLYPMPNNKIRYTRQAIFQYYLENT